MRTLWLLSIPLTMMAWGQKTAPGAPVSILEVKSVADRDGVHFQLKMRNDSAKEIVGYVIVCEVFNAAGSRIDRVETDAVILEPETFGVKPGALFEHACVPQPVQILGDTPASARAEVDSVLFRDLYTAGPNHTRRALRLKDKYSGAMMQLTMLRHLYRTKGVEAVLKILEGSEPRFRKLENPPAGP
jgi:hypothetical protein